jgi:potassium efflux system protein
MVRGVRETTPMNRIGLLIVMVLAGAAVAAGPATVPTTRPALVDLTSVATQAESVTITLRQVEADAASDRTPDRVNAELPGLTAEIDARLDETSNLLASNPSLQVLDGLAGDWEAIDRELDGWSKGLQRRKGLLIDQVRVVRLDDMGNALGRDNKGNVIPAGRLQTLEFAWSESRDTAQFYADHARSDDARERMFENLGTIDGVVLSLRQTRDDLSGQLSTIFGLLHQLDLQQARVADVIDAVRSAREQAWDRLFQRDGDPVWSIGTRRATVVKGEPAETASVAREGQGTFRRQWDAVRAYVGRHRENLGLHVALVAALAAGLMIARRWVRRWAEADPSLNRATLAFTAPIATALVLSFLASVWIYPQAPRLFWAALGAAALIPTVYLLRRVVEPRLFVILDALVAFYFADQVRLVAASVPLVARGLFLAEMLGGVVVLAVLVRARWDRVPTDVMGWVVHIGVRLWLAVFALCLLADAVGFVSLAELAGGAALGGGYLAVILYACARIVGGLVVILLRSRPLSLLNGVRRHQPLLLRRLTGAVDWVAAAFWGVGVLAMLSARPAVFAWAYWFYHLPVHFGAIEFTPSHVAVFALTVYASFLISRFVQFVLDEDVYIHIHLAGGLSYAINRIVHYTVVVAGVYIAVAAVGVPITQLSLLVGALTVGLGFGLQNVVNNFVSGLILLFERPIKVGDLIQMSDATAGTVTYIGIRASIIRTPDSSEVIVPNGNLISNQLTNWTRTTRERGLMIPVSTSADAEPTAVMKLLTDVAAAHPLVVTQPRPTALLTKFGADAFSYELRAWTNSADQWAQVRSDLSVALHAALVQAGIGIK